MHLRKTPTEVIEQTVSSASSPHQLWETPEGRIERSTTPARTEIQDAKRDPGSIGTVEGLVGTSPEGPANARRRAPASAGPSIRGTGPAASRPLPGQCKRAGPPRESNVNPARESVSIAASSRSGMVTGTAPATTRGYSSAGSFPSALASSPSVVPELEQKWDAGIGVLSEAGRVWNQAFWRGPSAKRGFPSRERVIQPGSTDVRSIPSPQKKQRDSY